jgi:hypothetical protein
MMDLESLAADLKRTQQVTPSQNRRGDRKEKERRKKQHTIDGVVSTNGTWCRG